MTKLIALLEGKKTYIATLGGVLSVLAYSQGMFDREVLDMLIALFGLSGIAALRSGIAKSAK